MVVTWQLVVAPPLDAAPETNVTPAPERETSSESSSNHSLAEA
jgi:hypothetical protein